MQFVLILCIIFTVLYFFHIGKKENTSYGIKWALVSLGIWIIGVSFSGVFALSGVVTFFPQIIVIILILILQFILAGLEHIITKKIESKKVKLELISLSFSAIDYHFTLKFSFLKPKENSKKIQKEKEISIKILDLNQEESHLIASNIYPNGINEIKFKADFLESKKYLIKISYEQIKIIRRFAYIKNNRVNLD